MLCGIYLRISDDREGTEAGVTRQEEDCRRLADTRGWMVSEVYRENDTSAFTRRKVTLPDGTTALRVVRPEFRRMLEDLAAGRVEAVIGYHLDRVARDPRDLEDLIDVVESTGRPAVTVGGAVDLSTDGGITLARVAVAVANQSSRDASRRIKRAKLANAEKGRWNGGGSRAYGYTKDRTEIVTEEADIVRELARRVLAGESARSITRDLNARSVPTVTGVPWQSETVKSILTGGIAAGRLRHNGQIVGPATWPAIIDLDTYERLVDFYANRPRNSTTMTHWLSGVLHCGECGRAMRFNKESYVCVKDRGGCNKIWVKAEHVEDLVARAIAARLISPPPSLTAAPAVDDTQLEELAEMWGAQEISLKEYKAARKKITARLAAAKPVRVPAWVDENLPVHWPTLTATQKNVTAKSLLASAIVDPCPSRRWNPDRVRLTWR